MDTDVKKKEPQFYNSLLVTPLVEIFNITVDDNLNDAFQVYGSITVIDRGHTFSIYDRTKDSPQSMVSGGKLLLTVEDNLRNAVIIPSEYVSLNVNLIAISGHDKITLQGKIPLNRTTCKDDYWLEEYKIVPVVDNNNCTVKVQYAIFQYAVAATVRVMHFSKGDNFDSCVVSPDDNAVPREDNDYTESEDEEDEDEYAPGYESEDEEDVTQYTKHSYSDITKLHGSISAFAAVCGNNDQMSSLFSKQPEECVEVHSGRYINLSRSVVAVPAYSSLKIQVSFFDGSNASRIPDATIEFKPADYWRPYKKDIAIGNGRIRVQVVWRDAYAQLYRNNPSGMWVPTTLDSRDDDSFKKQRVMSEQQVVSKQPSPVTSDDDCSLSEDNSSESFNWVLPSSTRTEPLLELFSVVVCSKDNKPLKYYGSVFFALCCGPNHVFKLDESCPLDCPTSCMRVILKDPEREMYRLVENFALIVDIKDASSKAAISRGHIAFRTLNRNLLADGRICSVIRGKLGFAVVHYSIFSEAVHATVDIKPSNKCPPVIIKGKIYARYDNCEPGRCYQDELYKILLFCDEDGLLLNDSNPTLPLLKSLLSLPIESILTIEAADLRVSTVEGSLAKSKVFNEEIQFFNNESSPRQIGNDDLCLDVSVRFSRPWCAKR